MPISPEQRVLIQTQLARALIDAGDWSGASEQILAAEATAEHMGDARWKSHAAVLRGVLESEVDQRPNHLAIEAAARRAIDVFRACGDELGLARSWDMLANSAFIRSDVDLAGDAWRTAHQHAQRAQDPAEELRIRTYLPGTSFYGWRTTRDALRYCQELARTDASPMFRARLLGIMCQLHAWRGEFEVALVMREQSRGLLNELAVPWMTAETHGMYACVDALRGDWVGAEREAAAGYAEAMRHGSRRAGGLLPLIVEALLRQGRGEEARIRLSKEHETPGASDPSIASTYTVLRAWLAIEDDIAQARTALAGVRQEILSNLNGLDLGEILLIRGEVLIRLGDWGAAKEDLARALTIFERKEVLVPAAVTRELLVQLGSKA